MSGKKARAKGAAGRDVFSMARSVPMQKVLESRNLLVENRPICPGPDGRGHSQDDCSVEIVGNRVKCTHPLCAEAGHPDRPGERTTVDVVMLADGVTARTAANRLAKEHGLIEIPGPGEAATSSVADAWQSKLVRTEHGRPQSGIGNVTLILENDPSWTGRFAFNDFSYEVEVVHPLPWDSTEDFVRRPLCDNDVTRTAGQIQLEYAFSVGTDVVGKALCAVAAGSTYHPVREYLEDCLGGWDGSHRIDRLFLDYFGAEKALETLHTEVSTRMQTAAYLARVSRCFAIGCVARVEVPGCQLDNMTIFEGNQGTLKSSGLRTLFGEDRFTDELADPGSKDASEQLRGVWAVEMAELEQFGRADAARLKAFITRRFDRYRRPYGRNLSKFPRQNVFVGTTNVTDWGKDETGARRFWPVPVSLVDVEAIKRDRDQIWGEALAAFRAGERWHLTPEEEVLASAEQEDRRQIDAIEARIAEFCAGKDSASIPEVLEFALGLEPGRWDQSVQNRVSRVFRGWKWARSRPRLPGGKREYRFIRPVVVPDRVPPKPEPGTAQDRRSQAVGPTGPSGPGSAGDHGAKRQAAASEESEGSWPVPEDGGTAGTTETDNDEEKWFE